MGDLKGKLGGLVTAIKKGAETIADNVEANAQRRSWKKQILNKMYPAVVMKFAKEKNLKPMNLVTTGNASLEDYKEEIIQNVKLVELVEYCHRKNIPIRDITNEIDRATAKREYEVAAKKGNIEEKVKAVTDSIIKFNPAQNYSFELPYQTELIGWLKANFPDAVIEKQRGSSRPDIVIEGIAIEVKGPTREQDLQTIADKCMRYSINFKKGIIIVLFNVYVNSYMYNEWSEGIRRTYPKVIIIKK
jgi:hypothetical protein